ncbi:hypothetical protein COY25_00970 [Candidatus Uhrbacteria bacterium CG_4_10_14_0_2_um_filter_41_7]|uniref:DUF7282 domain-containing protein n=1 Tax=Candidatus Uhrbacteria bacterium CG_4_9_14_3_um_filter_41_35 TaxID=1975034 RepID=A0A2M7XG29_9BACT|nr:MAG: hypothetical protein COV92_03935 [Candidatus Uhrbacteria bacterium CG11_big_fil_rev_8_21_14_0_20_41_9]PIZ55479.1 MAG: hypothetical protein COY25_00970 [Candidatus Uhrbacteria bacterium CG_4_10_14_0_2_um_filter_41_7]PJA46821.1 MAG: hypothetical protein CO173_01195 [Candidatus Uhrbacteria bacterium CG_4_9_14_3_um_filter_41_35]
MKKDLLYLLGIVGFLVAAGFFFLSSSNEKVLPYRPVDVGGGLITVSDQNTLNTVTLSASLAAPGFITIHEALGRSPADIIGTSEYLEAGEHSDIVINLEQEMLPGYMYITLLHADNGDKVYETMKDLPVKVNEEVVRPDFIAQPDAAHLVIPGSEEAQNMPNVNENIE